MKQLRNHVVVITGASSGFGRGAAQKFARAGADLVLAARRGEVLEDVARVCRKRGVRVLTVETDVSEREQVEALADRAIGEFGRIDVWVNNAGVATYGRFNDSPIEEHEQVIRTNLLGTTYGSRAALEQFRRQGRGTLINVSSFAGVVSFPYGASYTASKHGIRGLGMALRQELVANGERNIHVCTVSPTSMDTPFFQHAANHTGRRVKPIPPVYDPQLVVDAIYNVALNPQGEVVVGGRAKVASAVAQVTPRMLERQMARRTHKATIEKSEPAPDTEGNLFAPVEFGTGVRGGWNRGRLVSRLGSVLAVGGPAALGWLLWNSAKERARLEERQAA
jgi:short-subunit dehydrogenase